MTRALLGQTVLYTLSQTDAVLINGRRLSASQHQEALLDERLLPGVKVYSGRPVVAGEVFPALVVRAEDPAAPTIRVLLDGSDDLLIRQCRSAAAGAGGQDGRWHQMECA